MMNLKKMSREELLEKIEETGHCLAFQDQSYKTHELRRVLKYLLYVRNEAKK